LGGSIWMTCIGFACDVCIQVVLATIVGWTTLCCIDSSFNFGPKESSN